MNNPLLGRCGSFLSVLLIIISGCGKSSSASPQAASAGDSKAAAPGQAVPPSGKGAVVEGERFTTRVINDRVQKLPLCIFAAPEKWRDKSEVTWNYEYVSNPVWAAYSIENPANEEAMFGYPAARFFFVRPNLGFSHPGQNSLGLIEWDAMPPLQALAAYVQRAGGAPKLQMVGSKELPDLAAALHATAYPKAVGVAVKITYELNGKPVEEEFYAIPYSVNIPYDGPQGRSWQTNWGLDYLHSFRAPAGTLAGRRPVFAAIAKSFRPNPGWQERYTAINAILTQQFNQQLQAGYDQIAAAGRLSRQISANNDAMIASIDRQLQASRASSGGAGGTGGAGGRSANDRFDDYVRGVDTTDDPYYGTSQHSSNEQYHWTDGYGSYRNSNEPGYDPNQQENGSWKLMQPAR